MNFETGLRLLLLLQETQARAYTPFVTESHRQRLGNAWATLGQRVRNLGVPFVVARNNKAAATNSVAA